jgi:predicted amidohydrolase YtcJ
MRKTTARLTLWFTLLYASAWAATPADVVYTGGRIYTADAQDRVVSALAIARGRIVYAGDDDGAHAFVGPKTRVTPLHGGFAMPGLVDGHMHPMEGGVRAIGCNLRYDPLTVDEFRRRLQACLDADRGHEPDGWLEATNWFQQAMLPAGTLAHKSMLDSLHTKRPILVRDAFGHTVLANSRALALGHIQRDSVDVPGGRIDRDASGEPNGLLEDGAYAIYERVIPPRTAAQYVAAARAALKEMASQGLTTVLDADTPVYAMQAFRALQKSGGLTIRMHFAPQIAIDDMQNPAAAVARVVALRRQYDDGPIRPAAGLTLRNAKFFIDGVISGPAFTGAMLEPYWVNAGSAEAPRWTAGTNRGPEPYFPTQPLAELLTQLGRAGIDPHLHVDGDRAVRTGLDAVAILRRALPTQDVRVAFAHDEIVHPDDFARFNALSVYPVLSFQWEKRAPDTVDQAQNYLGPARFSILEPAGLLAKAGAPIAFGSDWPVDALNEWFALKVGITRENDPSAGAAYAGRLGDDPGLSRLEALRAITIMAARQLHCEEAVGSLEVGKVADIAFLDRDPLVIDPHDIAHVTVRETVLGGRTVYRAH